MPEPVKIQALNLTHDRNGFNCGVPALDNYFSQQVGQDVRRRISSCFVAKFTQSSQIVGFYTLASSSVLLSDLPLALSKRLPRYPSIPAVKMGRLAVDARYKSQGLGSVLLADAVLRSASAEIASFALLVDAKDDQAAVFYQHHGFLQLPESRLSGPQTLFLALKGLPGSY